MFDGKSKSSFRKVKTADDRRGKIVQARTRKRVQKLKKRLEADGVAEALRSFVRAAIAQSQGEAEK